MSILMSNSLSDKLGSFETNYVEAPHSQQANNLTQLPIKVSWNEEDFIFGELGMASFDNENNLKFISIRTSTSPMSHLLSRKKIAFIEFCDVGYNYDIQEKQTKTNVTKSLDFYILEIILENQL